MGRELSSARTLAYNNTSPTYAQQWRKRRGRKIGRELSSAWTHAHVLCFLPPLPILRSLPPRIPNVERTRFRVPSRTPQPERGTPPFYVRFMQRRAPFSVRCPQTDRRATQFYVRDPSGRTRLNVERPPVLRAGGPRPNVERPRSTFRARHAERRTPPFYVRTLPPRT